MSATGVVRPLEHLLELRDGLRTYCREYVGPTQEWPVLCLPGITRNCRDFEDLAPELARTRRVFTPDLRGRGRSDRDPDWRRYNLDSYVADVVALMDHFALGRVVIIGTSLGGIIGMTLGARHPQRLAGLVLNDIGPELDPVGLQRIGSSVGEPLSVVDWDAAAERARVGYAAILPDYTPDTWQKFARRIYREIAPGRIERDMDPGIARALAEYRGGPQDFWQEFHLLAALPMLCLRGEWSDLLSVATLRAMQRAHPQLQTVTITARGHTPTLDEPASRAAINAFLATLPRAV